MPANKNIRSTTISRWPVHLFNLSAQEILLSAQKRLGRMVARKFSISETLCLIADWPELRLEKNSPQITHTPAALFQPAFWIPLTGHQSAKWLCAELQFRREFPAIVKTPSESLFPCFLFRV